VEKQKVK